MQYAIALFSRFMSLKKTRNRWCCMCECVNAYIVFRYRHCICKCKCNCKIVIVLESGNWAERVKIMMVMLCIRFHGCGTLICINNQIADNAPIIGLKVTFLLFRFFSFLIFIIIMISKTYKVYTRCLKIVVFLNHSNGITNC